MEVYRIWYDTAHAHVVMEWNGYANSAQFRAGTLKMLDALKQNGCGKVLGDIRNMVLIGREDQEWLTTTFLPDAVREGFYAIALVQPHHYFNKVAVETIAGQFNEGKLKIRFFDSVSEATDWLNSCVGSNKNISAG